MAAFQVQEKHKSASIYKIVDSLVVGYLRKRGYDQTENSLLVESTFLKSRDLSRPFLISTTLNDKSLDDIVETFYNHGRFDAPPELLVMEQQLRDFSSTFTSFVVNYSRANQEKVMEKQRRFVLQQQQQMQYQQAQMQQQQLALRQQARRNFANIKDGGQQHQQRIVQHRDDPNTTVFHTPQPIVVAQPQRHQRQLRQENRNTPVAEDQMPDGHFLQQQQHQYQQPQQVQQEQYDEPMDQSVQQMQDQQIAEMIQQQENEEYDNAIEGASKRKTKPRKMEVGQRAFVNIIEGVQTAIQTSSTESLWDTLPYGELPMDEEVSCQLLVQYVNENDYQTNESLVDLRDHMNTEEMEIIPASATPPVAETVTVESETVIAPPAQEFSREAHDPPVELFIPPPSVVPHVALIAAPEPVISPPPQPSVPMFAARKIDPVKVGVVTSESTSSELSTASEQLSDMKTAKQGMSMDDLFGDTNDSSGTSTKTPAPVEKTRKARPEQKKSVVERAPSKGDHHLHKHKESHERIPEKSPPRVHESPRHRTDSQDRPSSNSSAMSASSPHRHRPSSPRGRHDSKAPSTSRQRSPSKTGGRNRGSSPSSKPSNRSDRPRQQQDRRKTSDDKRSSGNGESRKRNAPGGSSGSKVGSHHRSSGDDRPPSRSGDSQAPKDPRIRSPERRDHDKTSRARGKSSAAKLSSSDRREEKPLKSILSKKNTQPKNTSSLAGIESDVLGSIATNMDNLRKPEKPMENPFPTNPMFGFPIAPKMPQIKIPKMKSVPTVLLSKKIEQKPAEQEKKQEDTLSRHEIKAGVMPACLPNILPTGTISDSRLAILLNGITNKRQGAAKAKEVLESGESPTAAVSQVYDSSGDGQGYQGYQASVEQPDETPPKSAKRPKIDLSQMDEVMSRIHGSAIP